MVYVRQDLQFRLDEEGHEAGVGLNTAIVVL